MSTRYRLLISALIFALVSILLWALIAPAPEPRYQGKPLSYWLTGFDSPHAADFDYDWPSRPQAHEAVSQIGTNAIPTLLRFLRQRNPGLKQKLLVLVHDRSFIKLPFHPDPAADVYERVNGTGWAFQTLKSQASNAVPALIQIYSENISRRSRATCLEALCEIGPSARPAIPVLLDATTDGDVMTRFWAVMALSAIDEDTPAVTKALVHALNDSNSGIRDEAANALLSLDPKAAARLGIK
jgi:HEAT repeats